MAKLKDAPGQWYRFTNQADDAVRVDIYDFIGESFWDPSRGVSARKFVKDFSAISAPRIDIHINSSGGLIFDGVAISNAIKQHPAHCVVHIDGLAASIASVIAMAGHEVRMANNAFMMIHDPMSGVLGRAEDMRREAEALDKFRAMIAGTYAARSNGRGGGTQAKFEELMAAETWLTADECKDLGLIDAIDGESAVGVSRAAAAALDRYAKVPERVKQFINMGEPTDSGAVPGFGPAIHPPEPSKEEPMGKQNEPDGTTTPAQGINREQPASFAELQALAPQDMAGGARSDFIIACQAEGLTLAAASSKLIGALNTAAKEATAKVASIQKLGREGTGSPAVPPSGGTRATPPVSGGAVVGAGGSGGVGGVSGVGGAYGHFESYDALIDHLRMPVEQGGEGLNRAAASTKANKARPDLRAAHVGYSTRNN